VHDLLVFWNEVCDNMLRATDDDTAKELLKVQFKLLEKKHEQYCERIQKRLQLVDSKEAKGIDEALVDYYFEILATEKRLANCQDRLDTMIKNAPDHHEYLKKIKDWPESKKRVILEMERQLGDYKPDKDDAFCPKQFGNGIVLSRPQFKRAPKKQEKLPAG